MVTIQIEDKELEFLYSHAFSNYLSDNGWDVNQVKATNIFDRRGVILTDWDGVFVATHHDECKPVLYILEAKQVFTNKTLSQFKLRLEEGER